MSTGASYGRESPAHWSRSGRPAEIQYPPPQPHAGYLLPPSQQGYSAPQPYQQPPNQAPEMVTLPPPPQIQQDMYRPQMQAPHYDAYVQQPSMYPPQQGQAHVAFNQPAPRQRTAIACRYCRRRKIRCHGFDQNPEGRCSNCTRFNQECIFTPVSSQTHAFVPAHTAYPHLRNQGRFPQTPDGRPLYPQQGPPLYGAHGQPLGPVPPPQQAPDAHYPPPPGPHQSYGAPAPYPSAPYDPRGPPPHPPLHDDQQRRMSTGPGYEQYPDPSHMAPISPASSTASYQPNPYSTAYYQNPPQHQQPQQQQQQQQQQPPPPQQQQHTPTTQRRTSPTSTYSYENTRTSASPHGSVSGPGVPHQHYGPYPGSLHPPQVIPPGNDGRNASPGGQGREGGRSGGMSVRDMLDNSQSSSSRSNTDNTMLNALNRRAP